MSPRVVVRDEHRRFLEILTANIEAERLHRDEPIVVAMSGGFDSTMLLAVAVRLYGATNVRAVTFSGPNPTSDERRAAHIAKSLGVTLEVVRSTALDVLTAAQENPHFAYPVKKVFDLQYATMFRSFYEREPGAFDILNGGGADGLYGSRSWRLYVNSAARAKAEGITLNEARTRDKYDDHVKRVAITIEGPLWRVLTRAAGKNPIRPFDNPNLEWVVKLPYSMILPLKKQFPRIVLEHLLGVDVSPVQRMNMQEGTGIYHALKELLCERYNTKSANAAVKLLTRCP